MDADREDSERPARPAQELEQPDAVVTERERRPAARLWYLLLLVPVVALLWVPLYASKAPELWGLPFFYWYQFAWVPLTAVVTWIVFVKVR